MSNYSARHHYVEFQGLTSRTIMELITKTYTKMIVLLRWAIAAYLLAIFLPELPSGAIRLLNIEPVFLLSIIGIYYITVTFLLFYSQQRSQYYFIIVLDLLIAGVLLLNQGALPGNVPSVAFVLVFSLPILQSAFINRRFAWLVTVITAIIFTLLQQNWYQTNAQNLPPFYRTPEFAFVLVFFFLVYLGNYLFDILKKQERQANSLLSIIKASQVLGTTANLEKILNEIANIFKNLFLCQTAVIYLLDQENPDDFILKIALARTNYAQVFSDFSPKVAKSILSKVFQEKKGCLHQDFSKAPQTDELLPKIKGLKSMMITPLVYEDKVIGIIFLAHPQANFYTQDNLNMLNILANQIAVVIQNIQLHQVTKTLAVTDSLSGMFTHGYFQEHLRQEITKHKYANKPLSLLIIDVDFFKKVNDLYGHPQGDSLLKQLGVLIKTIARETDVICRYGGDEFTVTMLGTNRIEAVLMAERIRQTTEEYEFVLGSKIVHITVSGGVASFPEGAETQKELVEKADTSLYEAKKRGRNKICFGS